MVGIDRHGVESPVDLPPVTYNELALAPDGTRLALVGGQGGISDLWVADLARGAVARLTTDEFTRSPVWTPDGTRIVYGVLSPGAGETHGRTDWRSADGSRAPEALVPQERSSLPTSVTPDGSTLLYDPANLGAARGNVWMMPPTAERAPPAH